MSRFWNPIFLFLAVASGGCFFETPSPSSLACSPEGACPPDQFCDLARNECRKPAADGSQCGDGQPQDAELCDLGAANEDRGLCTLQCTPLRCGDGLVGPGENCDDGNSEEADTCLSSCAPPSCGDGILDEREECDDGNADDTDACLSTCVNFICGDGFVGPGEACDDANGIEADACTSKCAAPTCGDGQPQAGEACDDGNEDNTDSCLSTCVLASCGDGFVGPGEQCDDFDDGDNGDECVAACQAAICGDSFVQVGVEECDDGEDGDDTDECVSGCAAASCGDSFVHSGVEQCDDGDRVNPNSCSVFCEESWPLTLLGVFFQTLLDEFNISPNNCNDNKTTRVSDLLVDPSDERITIAGGSDSSAQPGGWMLQLQLDGTPIGTPISSFQGARDIRGLAHDGTGRILMVGIGTPLGGGSGTWFGRFKADASLDFVRVLADAKQGRDVAETPSGQLAVLKRDQVALYSADGQTEAFAVDYVGADARRMSVDAQGALYAVGQKSGSSWLSKTDATGAKLFGEGLTFASVTALSDVALMADGTLVVVGQSSSDAWIATLGSDGAVLAELFVDGPVSGIDLATSVQVDSTGDLIVGGEFRGASNNRFRFVGKFRYDPVAASISKVVSGLDTWEHLESSFANGGAFDDRVKAIGLSARDHVVIGAEVTTECLPGDFGPSVQVRVYSP